MIRLTIEKLQQVAASRGGKCLSAVYVNTQKQLIWECAKGHRWRARPWDILEGHWCKRCAGLEKKTIEEMRVFAATKNGRCLSKTYKASHPDLHWK